MKIQIQVKILSIAFFLLSAVLLAAGDYAYYKPILALPLAGIGFDIIHIFIPLTILSSLAMFRSLTARPEMTEYPPEEVIVLKFEEEAIEEDLAKIPVNAKIKNIYVNKSLSNYGINPWQIQAEWVDGITSETYNFKSKNLWCNPERLLKNGSVRVIIDINNPNEYIMDTSFLPQTARLN